MAAAMPERGEDDHYDAAALLRVPPKRSLPGSLHGFHAALGFQTRRRNNLKFIEDDVILRIEGNSVLILNLQTGEQRRVFGYDGEGVGAIAVHPSREYFAVAEKGDWPNVYIYSYPSLRVFRVCRKGTERAFSDLQFNASGDKLATVGNYPDFLLTVWDWKAERITLHTKAFAQEVFNCSFSPDNDGFLTTSGTGHIRFWKMASTFTGLKLQGDIGKFGKVELSDVEAYATLPDGKRLSATERGALLMWDGNLIKYELLLPGQKCPHDGNVCVIQLDREAGYFVTAGVDGVIFFWDFDTLDQADVGEDQTFVEIEPTRRIELAGVSVREIVRRGTLGEGARWLLQDANSGLYWLDVDEGKLEAVVTSHAGPVVALEASPVDHFALTAGADGAVRCWDYVNGKVMFSSTFCRAATCAKWCNTTLERDARTAAVGFEDGVVRILRRHQAEWRLTHCFKPHNGKVNGVAWSPNARSFATVGDDGTLFVLRCPEAGSDEYTPVGFYSVGIAAAAAEEGDEGGESAQSTAPAALCLDWRADSEAVLVGCADGTVVEAPLPDGTEDTHESYLLSASLRRRVVKPAPPRKSAAQLQEEKEEAEAAAAAAAAAMADDPFAAAAEENAAADAAAADAEADVVCPISTVLYKPPVDSAEQTSFIVSFESDLPSASNLYEFDWDGDAAIDVLPGAQQTTTCTRLSASGRFVVSGTKDGKVGVRPVGSMCGVLQIALHDGVTGQIGGATTSFDDKFVLSGGHDGHIFVSRLLPDELENEAALVDERARRKTRMAKSAFEKTLAKKQEEKAKILEDNKKEGAKAQPVPDPEYEAALAKAESEEHADEEEEPAKAVLPVVVSADAEVQARFGDVKSSISTDEHDTAAEAGVTSAADITDAAQYSIQDDKLKTEADHQQKLAEEKKDGVREQVESLRVDFAALRKEVEALESGQRISDEDFVIEPAYFAMLDKERQNMLQEVRNELEHHSEKCTLALEKLKKRFLNGVEQECFSLRALKATRHVVNSFGSRELSEAMNSAVTEAKEYLAAEKARAAEAAAQQAEEEAKIMASDGLGVGHGGGAVATGSAAHGEGTGYEVRKRLRKERREHMAILEAAKPSIDADDPKDVLAMQKALATMGDFKLKMADDYVVPEGERVNAEAKNRQCALLAEAFYGLRTGFNRRFMDMREKKDAIIAQVRRNNAKIASINRELGDSEELWEPTKDSAEYPETRETVSDADVNALLEERKRAVAAEKGENYTAPPQSDDAAETQAPQLQPVFVDVHQKACASASTRGLPRHIAAMMQAPAVGEESAVQAQQNEVHRKQLRYERGRLRRETSDAVMHFDHEVAEMCMQRAELAQQLQLGRMRQHVMANEYQMLLDFESKDAALAQKLAKAQKAKEDVAHEIDSCGEKLVQKQEELAVWQEKDKLIMEEFSKLVGASNQFEPQLLKMFKRKIKRAKKRTGDEDEDEDSDEDWEEDSDEDDDDDDDDDDEEDACPPGCDQTLYDKVLELREKRLDQEEILNEFQKAIDELKRTGDRHKNRQVQIDKDLKGSKAEIQLFQNEKQKKLNEIMVCTPLNFDQVHATVPKDPESEQPGPPELLTTSVEECLIFSADALKKLKSRSKELVGENKTLRANYRELHKTKTRLEREKKQQVGEIATLEKRCEELQMLKFGQKIDLQALDLALETQTVDDVQEKIRVEELKNDRQIMSMKTQYKKFREAMLRATQENTTLLQRVAELSQKQFKLEKELNASGGQLHVNDRGPIIKNETEERNRLVQLVKLQAKEVDALKSEVNMLRRKGGHVYTPAVAPQPAPQGGPEVM